MPAGHLTFGREGEELAVNLLTQRGYRLLERNWLCKRGEVDIIAMDGDTLVFVEVKSRGLGSRGSGAEAVGAVKQRRIVRAASEYLSRTDNWSLPCRFDVVSVTRNGQELEAQLLQNAFEAPSDTAGTGWQPW